MTPDQVRAIVDQALSRGVDLHLSVYLVLLVITVAGGILVPLATSYLTERGKNFATKQDLDGILQRLERTTQATEDIKARISGALWTDQQRRAERREAYERLFDALVRVERSIELLAARRLTIKAGDQEAAARFLTRVEALNDNGIALRLATLMAAAVLPREVTAALDALQEEFAKSGRRLFDDPGGLDSFAVATKRSLDALVTAVRKDLTGDGA